MPDFQEHYGLRLTEIVGEWPAAEVLLLIRGLPASSRLSARMAGDESGAGWSQADWLALDVRNAVEALRVMQANQGKKKTGKKVEFRTWDQYPGAAEQKRRETRKKLDKLRKSAGGRPLRG